MGNFHSAVFNQIKGLRPFPNSGWFFALVVQRANALIRRHTIWFGTKQNAWSTYLADDVRSSFECFSFKAGGNLSNLVIRQRLQQRDLLQEVTSCHLIRARRCREDTPESTTKRRPLDGRVGLLRV